MKVLIAYGYHNKEGKKVNAYGASYVELDMRKLFAEEKPSLVY